MRKSLLYYTYFTFLNLLAFQLPAQIFTWDQGAGIPDNSCSSSSEYSLMVSGVTPALLTGTNGLEKVCLDISHPFTGDLTITLISPKNREVNLVFQRGEDADFDNTCFDGLGASGSIATGVSPFSGTFLPEESLGLFNQGIIGIDSANGIWILRVCDEAADDIGSLNSFSLFFGNNPAAPPPTNDECENPLTIPVSSNTNCMGSVSGTLIGATASAQANSCSGTGNFTNDVWFSFTANEIAHDIVVSNITGSTNALDFQLGEGLCNAYQPLFCFFDPAPSTSTIISLGGFVPGSTYLLRIASFDDAAQNTTFDLCVRKRTPLVGDDCSSAKSVTVNDGFSCPVTTSGSLQNAIPSIPQSNCTFFGGPTFDNDVWFSFQATETSHFVATSNISGASTDLIYEFLSGSCANLTSLYCQDEPNDGFVVNNLSIGNTYFIRVASYNSAPENITFDMCVRSAPAAPVNDECSAAINIPISPPTCDFKVSGSLNGATMSSQPESCNFGSPFQNDVWFCFTATQTAHEIEVSNFQNPSAFMLYQTSSGSCEALVQKHCFGFLQGSPFNANNLTIGTKYYFRVASLQYNYSATTFDICIKGTISTPPSNDECVSAPMITPTSTQNCTASLSGTLLGATASNTADCSGSGGFDDDVWYRFVATEVSHMVALENTDGSTQDLDIQVLSGTCGSLSEIACYRPMSPASSMSFEINGLAKMVTYFIRVASFPSGIQTTTFEICVHDTISDPPANDECSGAEVIDVTLGETCTTSVNGTMLGATASGVPTSCGGAGLIDVWYRFNAKETAQLIDLSNISGSTQNLTIQIFSGTCGSLAELLCYVGIGPDFNFAAAGLTAGVDYYLRVIPEGGAQATFSLCIKSVPPAGCPLLVTSTSNAGAGSLREMISCAQADDTIRFDGSLVGLTIELDLPTILVDKNLVLFSSQAANITLSNDNAGNTQPLISLQNNLSIVGLKLIGKTDDSMIYKIESGGGIELNDTEVEKISIDKSP